MSPRNLRIGSAAAIGAILIAAVTAVGALAAGPPYPEPVNGQRVYDTAGVFSTDTIALAERIVDGIEARTGAEVVVYTQLKPESDTAELAEKDAIDLMDQWRIGRKGFDDGLVILFDLDETLRHGQAQLYAGPGYESAYLSNAERQAIFEDVMLPLLRAGDLDAALLAALVQVDANATTERAQTLTAPAGPPYPEPVDGQRVYDTAGVLTPATVAEAEKIADAIEARTGAQVVVYTQLKPESDTSELAEQDAIALMDQWGIGRKGFDDGLVILFDLDESRLHGQVQLYAGPGFRTAFLSNEERQAIYENDMLPLLRGGDLDGATLAAMRKVDASATQEHAQALERGRLINAVFGLLVGPGLFLLLVAWPVFHWLRYGRDPVFVDDPSVLMPAPPADLTAASGALVYDGQSSRRALTTALLDLASRGQLAFEQKDEWFKKKVSIRTQGTEPVTGEEAARRRLNDRKPLSDAERYALGELRDLAPDGQVLEDTDLLKFGEKVGTFDEKLEAFAVNRGWFAKAPGKVSRRWTAYGIAEIVGGAIALFVGIQIPFSGLVVLGGGLIAAGIVTTLLARAMPARTMAGATIRAMLAAYRRTLEKTMAQARSMDQVVEEAKIDWLETPDQAMVWAVALGLQHDAEAVLERSREDVQAGRAATVPWFPVWYGTSQSFAGGAAAGAGGSVFSASAVPDFGGMFGVLGSVGNSPSSSGGGGFGGGGSGGGGGGAGGGF